MKTKNIIDFVGNTPLVEVQNIFKKDGVTLLLKLEGNNPGGSVKDRAAFNMINEAINKKNIKKGDTLVEATSGNTGIALALMAKVLGVNMVLVMPENSTIERVQTMRAYGAKVILTPAELGIEGSRDYALKLKYKKGYYRLNQFDNPDNSKAHYKTTGPEIWRDTEGEVTHFVSSMGTTGTIMGVSDYLKEKNKNITIVGVQPDSDSKIPGIRKWEGDYIPAIFNRKKVDEVYEVTEAEAKAMTQRLAEEEGIFAGMSSGGNIACAIQVAEKLEKGVVVAIVCDRGDRYLSSDLFDKN
ncbi:cysteine synthase CysM [Polaribacter gangjinensis]|uniref:Cysteine synthase n=1 Tax=Polaribacter gangjinensis TaxID=574710 RepID=A0A2S7WCI6_9FLAO|nr:cysteine synthase CysM [Polaribacter gangjinensis]PQJ75116.1 cysteine synthase B [Polaribacter gangjinensis]